MNLLDYFDRALIYIEEHLKEPITSNNIAKHIYLLNFYYQRMFSVINIAEYIRNRKLSKAGQKLWKVIYMEWLPNSPYEIILGYDFECYSETKKM